MSQEAAARAFFAAPNFAVVGASTDPAKFGHKIFSWYIHHSLPATPINPQAAALTVEGESKSFDAVKGLAEIPNPSETAVSIITPPKVTQKVLEEAKQLGFPYVWLQPGTFDDAVMQYAKDNFKAAVGGMGGGTVGGEGWCVLVDGERVMEGRGKL